MKRMLAVSVLLILSLLGCSNSDTEAEVSTTESPTSLNITILLDLSDRLVRDLVPAQKERDIAVVQEFTQMFKESMQKSNAFGAKDKIQIIFRPPPANPNINSIARDLQVDLETMKPPEKKEVYDTITNQFSVNLNEIYNTTLENEDWIGSDIWRFFKNDVKDLAIQDDSSFRNILVILTDGYIYHENSARRMGNKSTYITNSYFESIGIYNQSNWRSFLEENDYGLIEIDEDLSSLEVIFLEVNPYESRVIDEEIIRWYLSNWLEKMSVKNFRIYNTDLTNITTQRLRNFIE